MVDNNGNAVNHYVYDSFGNVVSQTGETVISRYLYTGREWDSEIDLQFNRGRYLNSRLGIFINEDPIGFSSGTPNLYGYVENNPINAIDPFGLTSEALITLLSVAKPRNGLGSGDSIYYYPESSDYFVALAKATTWFYLITDSGMRSGTQNPNPRVPQMKWLLNAPLKVNQHLSNVVAGGRANLRPAGLSGSDLTIDLTPDMNKPKRRHENSEYVK